MNKVTEKQFKFFFFLKNLKNHEWVCSPDLLRHITPKLGALTAKAPSPLCINLDFGTTRNYASVDFRKWEGTINEFYFMKKIAPSQILTAPSVKTSWSSWYQCWEQAYALSTEQSKAEQLSFQNLWYLRRCIWTEGTGSSLSWEGNRGGW